MGLERVVEEWRATYSVINIKELCVWGFWVFWKRKIFVFCDAKSNVKFEEWKIFYVQNNFFRRECLMWDRGRGGKHRARYVHAPFPRPVYAILSKQSTIVKSKCLQRGKITTKIFANCHHPANFNSKFFFSSFLSILRTEGVRRLGCFSPLCSIDNSKNKIDRLENIYYFSSISIF